MGIRCTRFGIAGPPVRGVAEKATGTTESTRKVIQRIKYPVIAGNARVLLFLAALSLLHVLVGIR